MKITFNGELYDCLRAVKTDTAATLYLADGGTVQFGGVNDWDAFTIEGGEWSQPEVTAQEQLRADVDFLAAMTGVMLV